MCRVDIIGSYFDNQGYFYCIAQQTRLFTRHPGEIIVLHSVRPAINTTTNTSGQKLHLDNENKNENENSK